MRITCLFECHGSKLIVSVEGHSREKDVVEHIRLGVEHLDELVEAGTLDIMY